MGEFNSQPKEATPPAMAELEAKIGNMNQYLTDGRAELDRLEETKITLDKEIADLTATVDGLNTDKETVQAQVEALTETKKELDQKISDAKNELLLEETKLAEAIAAREAEEAKAEEVKTDLATRIKEVEQREQAARIFAAGLDEREKKLDEYAGKMERFVGGLKSLK